MALRCSTGKMPRQRCPMKSSNFNFNILILSAGIAILSASAFVFYGCTSIYCIEKTKQQYGFDYYTPYIYIDDSLVEVMLFEVTSNKTVAHKSGLQTGDVLDLDLSTQRFFKSLKSGHGLQFQVLRKGESFNEVDFVNWKKWKSGEYATVDIYLPPLPRD